MKTIDVLIIGAPKSGKSSIFKMNINKEEFCKDPYETIGGNVFISDYALPTGEVIKL